MINFNSEKMPSFSEIFKSKQTNIGIYQIKAVKNKIKIMLMYTLMRESGLMTKKYILNFFSTWFKNLNK